MRKGCESGLSTYHRFLLATEANRKTFEAVAFTRVKTLPRAPQLIALANMRTQAVLPRRCLQHTQARSDRSSRVRVVARQANDSGYDRLYSTAIPTALALTLANFPALQAALQPTADTFSALGLPAALIKWGHPGNMAVVLAAMGLYGSGYLGWAIRTSDNDDLVIKAKDLHPKLAVGMTIFFALGATGGLLSLTMQGKPIFESPHVWTGITGLSLLGIQGMLSLFFEDDPNARGLHAYLGTAILALFVVHGALGLQLGLGL